MQRSSKVGIGVSSFAPLHHATEGGRGIYVMQRRLKVARGNASRNGRWEEGVINIIPKFGPSVIDSQQSTIGS